MGQGHDARPLRRQVAGGGSLHGPAPVPGPGPSRVTQAWSRTTTAGEGTDTAAGSSLLERTAATPGPPAADVETVAVEAAAVAQAPAKSSCSPTTACYPSATETATVDLTLDERAFAHWDESAGAWHAAPGTYELLVGSSSRTIHRTTTWTRP